MATVAMMMAFADAKWEAEGVAAVFHEGILSRSDGDPDN